MTGTAHPNRRHPSIHAVGRSCALLLAGVTALAIATAGSPAAVADAVPNAQGQALTLAQPGVVYIETSFSVHVSLDSQLTGAPLAEHTYSSPWAAGTGFTVTPDGTIVTAGHVVDLDEQAIRNYATNRLLVKLNKHDDPFKQYRMADSFWDGWVQRCYHNKGCTFDIKAKYGVLTGAQVSLSDRPKPTPARLLEARGFEDTDIAVLSIPGNNLPTVPLAESAKTVSAGDDVMSLGFPGSEQGDLGGVTEPTKVFGKVSNVRIAAGATPDIQVDQNSMQGMSGGPLLTSSGQVIGLVSYVFLNDDQTHGQTHVRTVDDIRAILAAAGVTPKRGMVDTAFEVGMHDIWGSHFTAAIPQLQKVLNLYPGHPLAQQNLATAQEKAGTAVDIPEKAPVTTTTPGKGGQSVPVGLLAGIAIAAGLAVLVPVLAVRRTRRPRRQDLGVMAPGTSPVTATSGAATNIPQQGAQAMYPEQGLVSVGATANGSGPVEGEQFSAATTSPAPAGDRAPRQARCMTCGSVNPFEARFCNTCGGTVQS
jgi:S1-C subfamily serine protease